MPLTLETLELVVLRARDRIRNELHFAVASEHAKTLDVLAQELRKQAIEESKRNRKDPTP